MNWSDFIKLVLNGTALILATAFFLRVARDLIEEKIETTLIRRVKVD